MKDLRSLRRTHILLDPRYRGHPRERLHHRSHIACDTNLRSNIRGLAGETLRSMHPNLQWSGHTRQRSDFE
jgi:hypothetical protein